MNLTDEQLRHIAEKPDWHLPGDMAARLAADLLLARAALRKRHTVGDMKVVLRVTQSVDNSFINDEVCISNDILDAINVGDLLRQEMKHACRRVSDRVERIVTS